MQELVNQPKRGRGRPRKDEVLPPKPPKATPEELAERQKESKKRLQTIKRKGVDSPEALEEFTEQIKVVTAPPSADLVTHTEKLAMTRPESPKSAAGITWMLLRSVLSAAYTRAMEEGKASLVEVLTPQELDMYIKLVNTYLQCRKTMTADKTYRLQEKRFRAELEEKTVDALSKPLTEEEIQRLASMAKD